MRRARPLRWWSVLLALVVLGALGGLVWSLPRAAAPPQPVPNHAFRSAPAPAAPAAIWAVGDGANGSDATRALAQRIFRDRPARVLYLGDVYERGSAEDFRKGFDRVYGQLARVIAPTPGNHDWPAHPDGYDPYWRAITGALTPPWYAFRVGGWRVLSLNSQAPHDSGAAQLRWLTSELRRDTGTCTLAFWHRPFQSAGRHGDQRDVQPLWDALRGKATLVLNGHEHSLQRLRARDGITQLVAGAGGKNHTKLNRSDPRLAFGDNQRDGALRIQLRPGGARLAFVATDGTMLDRSSVSCEPDQNPSASARW